MVTQGRASVLAGWTQGSMYYLHYAGKCPAGYKISLADVFFFL